jgi:Astacin (Peptidase family M12A)
MAVKTPRKAAGTKKKSTAGPARKASAASKKRTTRGSRGRVREYCAVEPHPVPDLAPEVEANPDRASAIIVGRDKWANHTVLHYSFFGSGDWSVPDNQADVVRSAFAQWKALPLGLEFVEVNDLAEAEVRIGYMPGGGSWSYLGKDVLGIPLDERTMNFGWPLDRDADGLSTAVHEIGHTLGMPHEHQNPFAGIVWDEQAVYDFLGAPPNNWSRQTTFNNVLRKLNQAEVTGSQWDPDSVMEYEFPAGLIREPAAYRSGIHPPGTISPADAEWAKRWYPGDTPVEEILRLNESVTVDLAAGQQVDFTIRVRNNRRYTIGTFGSSDTLLTLFEDVEGSPRFLAGDDDSGTDRNASVTYRLRPGRTYHVRLRLYYKGMSGKTAVIYW